MSAGEPGDPGGWVLEDRTTAEPLAPEDDAAHRLALLDDVGRGRAPQVVRLLRPVATAAFSRRDALLPGFAAAQEAARGHGFAPVVRPVGGRMAPYHRGVLVVDVVGRSDDPVAGTTARFELVADAVVAVLGDLGLDARRGELPREYCPGEHSVHVVSPSGTSKVAGTAQRQTRRAHLVSTLLVLDGSDALRAVTTDVYRALGLDLDPSTVGSVADHVARGSGATGAPAGGAAVVQEVGRALADRLLEALAGRVER
ncbi:lipoate--protein ligase family protein [Quadrisphaera sp. INWT6]|uniref:lipoate--protein ligase family protein n=1 Tax=Quadrisphaera sp. INWT6 TaxID=2596917 RepID=UPI0018928339|nr:lipoate--protein ligase family protein [Quadrisphaera sp. INWT6]MBF5082489.1 lipoate--protein ligase family protein [Quadrisphaera sp. INWT6]